MVRDLRFAVYHLEETLSGTHGAPEELEGRAERLHGLEAAQDHERQKCQVHAPYFPPSHLRDRQDEYREHRQIHH